MQKAKIRPTTAFGALIVGGVSGGLACAFQLTIVAAVTSQPADLSVLATAPIFLLFLSIFTVPVFWIGMLLLGAPLWEVLHRRGATSVWVGALAGAVCASVTGQALTSAGFGLPFMALPWLVMPGGAAGFTVWRLIYPR